MSGPTLHQPPEFCSVEMSDGKRCGRTVHPQRAMEDPGYVCLMHSHDPNKGYSLSEEFDRELHSIMDGGSLHNRVKSKWDFQGFVFFKPIFSHWSISPLAARIEVNFARATFAKHADFSYSSFDCDVDLRGAHFERGCNFEGTRFAHKVLFWGASFTGKANFNWASFAKGAEFSQASFRSEASFVRTIFSANAVFRYVCGSAQESGKDLDFGGILHL